MNALRQRTFQTLRVILGIVGALILGVVGTVVGNIGGLVINTTILDKLPFKIGFLPLEWVIAIPHLFILGGLTGIIIFVLYLIHKKGKVNWSVSFLIIAVIYFVVSLASYLPFLRFSSRYYSYSLVETGSITNIVVFGMYLRHKINKLSWGYSYILTTVVCFCVGLFLF
ncbi:MAG: hypothetical protein AB1531_02010, partial [Chloroflexota bacterium]